MVRNEFLEMIDEEKRAETPAKTGANPFLPLIDQEEQDKGTAFRVAMTEARDTDPDVYAKQTALSKRTGIPVDVVSRNADKVEKQAPFLSGEYDTLIDTHPNTVRFLSEEDNAKWAKDDIPHLTVMEQIAKMNDEAGLVKLFGDSFMSALSSINTGIAQSPALVYNATAALYDLAAAPQNFVADKMGRPDQKVQMGTAPDWLLNNPVAAYYKKAAEHYAPEELHQDPIQLMKEGNGPQAARAIAAQVVSNLPQQLFLVASTLAGQPQVGLAGMGVLSASQATAEAQDNGKSPLMATLDAFGQGGIEVITERFGTVGIVKQWESALIKNFGKTTAKQVIADVGKSIAAAFFQEGAEEFAASVGQDFTDYITGNPKAMDNYVQRALNSFIIGGFSGGLVTAPTVITSAGVKAHRASQDGKFWDQMLGTSTESKLRQRSPEKFEKFVNNILAENGKPQNLYVSHDALQQFFQNDQSAFDKFIDEMNLRDQLAEASAAGKEFEISAAKFASLYAGSPISEALRPDMRFAPDGMTQREQVQLQQEYQKMVQEMQQEYAELVQTQKLPPEIQSMRDKMILPKEAGGAGIAAEDADAQLSVFMAGMNAFAKKSGLTLEEYVRKVNPVLNTGGEFVDIKAPTNDANTFTQARPIDYTDPKNVQYRDLIAQAGGVFIGTQPGFTKKSTGETTEGLVMFNDPQTNTTLVLKPSQLTPEAVAQRIAASRQQFENQGASFFQADQAQTQTPEFQAFFSGSKVVDEKGNPLVVYHGTQADFEEFQRQPVFGSLADIGFHFGPSAQANSVLRRRAKADTGTEGFNIKPVFLSIKNPLRMPDVGRWELQDYVIAGIEKQAKENPFYTKEEFDALKEKIKTLNNGLVSSNESMQAIRDFLISKGYDGIVYQNKYEAKHRKADSFIAFDPTQIKSAVGNSGFFDSGNPNILLQQDDVEITPAALAAVNWSKVNSFMKRKGYDFRGPEDAKEIFKTRIIKDGKINASIFPDHAAAIDYGSSKKVQSLNTKAKRVFGITPYFEEAGYLMPDGSLLDFSGRRDGYVGPPERNVDHREIHRVYPDNAFPEDNVGTRNMIDFMNRGNIRLQSNGIDVSTVNSLTPAQERKLARHIQKNGGEYVVDFSDANGNTVESKEYPLGTNPARILADIRNILALNKAQDPNTLFQTDDLGFFSKLRQTIEEKMPNAAPAQQIEGILAGSGVKQDEMEWMGVKEFLAGKAKITKQEMLDFIDGNQLQIKEVTLGFSPKKEIAKKQQEVARRDSEEIRRQIQRKAEELQEKDFQEASDDWFENYYNDYLPSKSGIEELDIDSEDLDLTEAEREDYRKRLRTADVGQPDFFGEERKPVPAPGWKVTFDGEDLGVFKTEAEAQEVFDEARNEYDDQIRDSDFEEFSREWHNEHDLEAYEEQAREELGIEESDNQTYDNQGFRKPKFQNYILDNGTNYREVLLTLPEKTDTNQITEIVQNQYGEWEVKMQDGRKFRYPDAATADEAKNIFTKQLQSGQINVGTYTDSFRSSHFDERNIVAHFRLTERNTSLGRTLFIEEIQSDWHQQGREKGYRKNIPAKTREELERRVNEIEEFGIAEKAQGREIPSEMKQEWADIKNTLENKGVPDGPFKKTWHELASKRILRMAVEEGYEALAWTTGEQQVQRYESALRTAVDKIQWIKTESGVQLIGFKGGREVVNTTQKETELSDAIGKAMAEKILAAPEQTGEIQGEDIKISDTGMAGFYDRIIPQFLSKYTKKWGGKVGQTEIDTKGVIEKPADAEGRKFLTEGDIKAKVHSLPITQEMRDSLLQGQPLFQGDAKPRGSVQFTDAATIINLYKSANMSTFLHESGHVFMREMKKLIDAGAADPQIVTDYETLKKFVGGNIESRAAQEKLARAFEAYLREGNAPSVKLVEAFRRFRDWLMNIYRTLRGLDVEINDEIRGVFDRMLASEAEIEEAKQFYRARKSIVDLVPVTPEQKQKVAKAKNDSEQAALEKAVKERLNIYLRLQGGKQAIREDATKQVDAQPVYKAIAEAIEKGGMDAAALKAQYGKETAEKLRETHADIAKYAEKGKAKKGDFDPAKAPTPAQLAATHGFESPDALIQAMLNVARRSEAITKRAKEILQQKEQELLQDLKGQEQVAGEEALHNEKSLTYLITEVEILSQRIAQAKNRRPDIIQEKLYRSVAQEVIGKKQVKMATRYDLFARAEQRFAKQAEAAIIQGDFETALVLKKKQLLNHALVLEAIKARDERRKIENFFKAKNYRAKLKNTENDFAQAAMDITSTYKVGTAELLPNSANALDRIKDIDEFLAMSIPEWIRLKQLPPNYTDYKDLTMNQFRELDDAVKAILQYGSNEMKSIEAGEAKTLQEWVEASVAEMEKLKDRDTTRRDESSKLSKPLELVDAFAAGASLVQFTSDWMDNFSFMKTGKVGPFKKLYNKVLQAEVNYTNLRTEVVKESKPAWDRLAKAAKRIAEKHGAHIEIPGVPLSEDMRRTKRAFWTVNRMIAFILNTGNAGNMEALKRAYGYSDQQIQKVASYFTAEELQAIQDIWNATDFLFPQLDETHFSMYNRHLPKVIAQPITFTSQDGKQVKLEGGYYPLVFDHKLSDRAAQFQEDDMMKNQTQAIIRSTKPEDGMTYARVEGHSLPPLLETHVWFSHINNTARYISHARILRDLNRFTRDSAWAKQFKKKAGDDHYKNIRSWLQYNANPARRVFLSKLDLAADWLKSLSTAAILGFKTAVGLKQRVAIINAAQAMGRDKMGNGWGWLLKSYREVDFRAAGLGLSQSETWEAILKKSPYLKTRDGNIDREISDMRRGIDPLQKKFKIGNKEFTPRDIQDFAFEWIKMNDRAVVSVVWTAAYNQYVHELAEKGATPDEVKKAAIAYADGIVQDTQASSLTPELSTMQRQEGWLRLFTSFMTSAVNYGNRVIQNYRAWNQGAITNKEFFNHVLQEYLAMPYAAYAISLALRGGDDEPEWWQWLLVPVESLFSFVPIIRDVFSYFNFGTDIGKSTVFEPLARTAKAIKATGQWAFGDKEFTEALWDIGRAAEVYTKVPALNFVKDIKDAYEKITD